MESINKLYKLTNLIINKLEAKKHIAVIRSKPVTVNVVLTKACNLACTFCRDYETIGSKKIAIENFEKAARQLLSAARHLNICSGGEPYLHPGLEEILRISRKFNVRTWVLSNGMLLKEDKMRRIIRDELITEHGFSVDGANAKTVERIRLNAIFDTIIDNIRMVVRIRKQERKKVPYIRVRYALMRCNIEELPAAVRMWHEIGVEELACNYLVVANEIDKNESLYFHHELTNKIFREAKKVANDLNFKLILPNTIDEDISNAGKVTDCDFPWRFVMIDTNGNILPCYRSFEVLKMGNVYDENAVPFKEIWNSIDYQQLRSTVNADAKDKFFPYCEKCEYRHGWANLENHLGEESWKKMLKEKYPEVVNLDLRRRGLKQKATEKKKQLQKIS